MSFIYTVKQLIQENNNNGSTECHIRKVTNSFSFRQSSQQNKFHQNRQIEKNDIKCQC